MSKATSMMQALIVDDEPDIRQLIDITLTRMGLFCKGAESLAKAHQLLSQQDFDLCLTDMRLPDGDGLSLVEYVQKHCPSMPIAVITAHGNMETAVIALKNGAFDFVSKPIDINHLRTMVSSALRLCESNPHTYEPTEKTHLVGHSEQIESLKNMITKVARGQAPIYITGESGVGKELVAKLIHEQSPRHNGPFIPVNCGAIPAELMESEFFGHKKGSFTGAHADKAGLFQAAHGGTLFLDEVAELSATMQVKLLRAIQEKAIRPVGEQTEQAVDVRIVSATHKNLGELVEQNQFRQDLYYRINVIELKVPSLRERSNDIAELSQYLLSRSVGAHEGIHLSKGALNALMAYSFPGNVRELENILERALALCEGNQIDVEDLQLPHSNVIELPRLNTHTTTNDEHDPNLHLETYLDQVEKDAIVKALEETRWNKTAAAKRLGISFRALRYRLKKLNLE